ncbi:MAG: hypothetical protein ABSC76_15930 [Terracidiphilus sp.]|jgi:hypothetical protein
MKREQEPPGTLIEMAEDSPKCYSPYDQNLMEDLVSGHANEFVVECVKYNLKTPVAGSHVPGDCGAQWLSTFSEAERGH